MRRPTIGAVGDEATELRHDLVERLRRQGYLTDDRVADAFGEVPRENFLPEYADRLGLAAVYRDEAIVTRRDPETRLPTSSSSQPAIMARMLEMLDLRAGQRVVEIGAGTGYNAALLDRLVGPKGSVTSVELDREVAAPAREALLATPAGGAVGAGRRPAGPVGRRRARRHPRHPPPVPPDRAGAGRPRCRRPPAAAGHRPGVLPPPPGPPRRRQQLGARLVRRPRPAGGAPRRGRRRAPVDGAARAGPGRRRRRRRKPGPAGGRRLVGPGHGLPRPQCRACPARGREPVACGGATGDGPGDPPGPLPAPTR